MSKLYFARRSWRKILYGHLALARISNSPTVISNTLAGAALAGGFWLDRRVWYVAVAMVLFYTAGMYLNDLLDYAIDLRTRPERPLPTGLLSRRSAAIVAFVLLIVGCLLLLSVGPLPFLGGLVLMALIICYDRWHKRNPFSPLVMALCRVMVYVIAFLALSSQSILPVLIPGGLLVSYVVGLTAIAKVEGKPRGIRFGLVVMLFLPALYFSFQLSPLSFCLVLIFTAWVTYSLLLIARSSRRQIGRAVGQLIAGIALYDGLVLAGARNIPGLVLALAAFGLTLFLQRYVKGT